MWSRRLFSLLALCAMLLWVSAMIGCIPFVPCPYVYPSVSCVPTVKIEEPRDEVHAFRVDIADDLSCVEFAGLGTYRLTEVRVWPGGWTCPQGKLALDGGYIWNCIALIYGKHTAHTVRVRLYRPGYELVEVRSWSLPRKIEWEPAVDTLAQEKAIDNLLAPTGHGFGAVRHRSGDDWGFGHLRSDWLWPWNRQALEFAAGEYERVAMSSPERDRCLAKARELREIAGAPVSVAAQPGTAPSQPSRY